MMMVRKILTLCWLMVLLFASPLQAQQSADDYRLAAGDHVEIKVFNEEELSVAAEIDRSGHIDYPLIGEIKLSGMTIEEAEQYIDKLLRGDYLVDPRVNVDIEKYRSFFITGAVNKPGKYEYRPGMTAREAIAQAGDFSKLASRRKVYVIRAGDKSYKEEKHDLDVPIGPGDTIRIKESLF
jgi:polysaccharide export outer membrane protein